MAALYGSGNSPNITIVRFDPNNFLSGQSVHHIGMFLLQKGRRLTTEIKWQSYSLTLERKCYIFEHYFKCIEWFYSNCEMNLMDSLHCGYIAIWLKKLMTVKDIKQIDDCIPYCVDKAFQFIFIDLQIQKKDESLGIF